MNEWTFRLNLAGLDIDDDARLDVLHKMGCDDATFATDNGGAYAVFHRQAPTPGEGRVAAVDLATVRDVQPRRAAGGLAGSRQWPSGGLHKPCRSAPRL